jgi:hypothetical protein
MSAVSFIVLCGSGKLHEAQQFVKLNDVDIHFNNDAAFRMSCINGHIETAKWLLDISNNKLLDKSNNKLLDKSNNKLLDKSNNKLYSLGGVNIHAANDGAFRGSCKVGHIELAKWLYSLGGVNIHADYDLAFRWSCDRGHIEIAKWLYSLGGVNIHADNDDAFRSSCRHNHIEITKWLLDISNNELYSLGGINIHAAKDDAFHSSCSRKHIETVIFLLSLPNKYNYLHKTNDVMAKILFDYGIRTGQIGNKIELTTELINIYTAQKQEILSRIIDHLIPDIADIIYYYV